MNISVTKIISTQTTNHLNQTNNMKNHYQIKSTTSGLVRAFVLAFLIVTFQVSNLFAQIPVTVSGTATTTPALNATYPN